MPPFNYTGHLHLYKLLMLGRRGGEGVTVELKPTAINPCGKKLPVQLTELDSTSFCDLLYLIWPQPKCFELSWKLQEFAVIQKH